MASVTVRRQKRLAKRRQRRLGTITPALPGEDARRPLPFEDVPELREERLAAVDVAQPLEDVALVVALHQRPRQGRVLGGGVDQPTHVEGSRLAGRHAASGQALGEL